MPVNFMSNDSDSEVSVGEEYEVEQILGMRILQDGTEEFKVRWKNYDKSSDTWEPKDNLGGAKDILSKFLQSSKAKKTGKKTTPKSSLTPAKNAKSRKRSADTNDQEEEEEDVDDQSSGGESDDDFGVPSSNKKKKTAAVDKKKKKSVGGLPSSVPRPAPHTGNSLTMAINRRMNLGQHSSWLDDSGSESDANSTTEKKRGADGGKGGGKSGDAARGSATKEEDKPVNGIVDNNGPVVAARDGNDDVRGHISDDSTATEKLANSPSPPIDHEAGGGEGNGSLEIPSEHDPPPLNLSTLLNGQFAKFGDKEQSTPSRPKRASKEEREQIELSGMKKTEKAKRRGLAPSTSKPRELKFDGLYVDTCGALNFIVDDGESSEMRVLTFEEAKCRDAHALCDYFKGMVKFTDKGSAKIEAPPNNNERGEKLNFDE